MRLTTHLRASYYTYVDGHSRLLNYVPWLDTGRAPARCVLALHVVITDLDLVLPPWL